MNEVVIVSALRTAIGSFGGTLSKVSATDMAAACIRECLAKGNTDAGQIDEVILGQVLQAGQGQNPARQATLKGDLPVETPAMTINKVCGSGLKAVALATEAIQVGRCRAVIAGGMENMSQAPHLLKQSRDGFKLGNAELTDSMIHDGLWDIFNDYHMGITAENLAEKYSIPREDMDAFAAGSQQKAEKAIRENAFEDEIVPIRIPQRKKEDLVFDTDEFPRSGTTAESLSGLRPAFKKDGTVTAGNSSGINDGACCLLLMSRKQAEEKELPVLATIKACASAGVDPSVMGIGPVPATRKVLELSGWRMDELDLIEANEAFAVQALAVGKELGWNPDIVNVKGGAIALGHPIGASGARILTTLVHAMRQRKAKKGLATLCIGGGQGIAMTIEGS